MIFCLVSTWISSHWPVPAKATQAAASASGANRMSIAGIRVRHIVAVWHKQQGNNSKNVGFYLHIGPVLLTALVVYDEGINIMMSKIGPTENHR